METKEIADKDWLELSWKYFQQHAQQRISYLNYFIVFSTVLSTGLISLLRSRADMSFLGIEVGIIQMFFSFIFLKIDDRNKYLTKHAESTLISIETYYKSIYDSKFQLFSNEKMRTEQLVQQTKSKSIFNRQFSHGKSYMLIYMFFALIGFIEVFSSIYFLIKGAIC